MEDKKEIINILLNELESRGIVKRESSTYKNTEKLLYEYPHLKESIVDRNEQIHDLRKFGLQEKSKSITSISQTGVRIDDENTIIQNNINSLQQHIYRTKVALKYIDNVLSHYKNDKYYEIIPMYYFERKTHEQIAMYFDEKLGKADSNTSPETIRVNKKRLINAIKTLLLPNDCISEILGY